MNDKENPATTQPAYSSYDEVPWYRKNWYALVCGLFFGPGIVPPLLTGNFYYQKNGQVIGYSKLARGFLIVWGLAVTLSVAVEVVKAVGPLEDEKVALVKRGTLQLCPNSTVSQMVDGFMGDPSWESGADEDGVQFVNVGGDITFHDKPVHAVIQFTVNEKEGSFQYQALEFNEVPQANLLAMGLMAKMCEGAQTQVPSGISEGSEPVSAKPAAVAADEETAASPVASAPPADTHCSSQEQVVFSCDTGKKLVSVCASQPLSSPNGYYRFGPKGATELAFPTSPAPLNTFTNGGTFALSGGGGAYMRLKNGGYHYVVFSAVTSGGETAGVSVEKNGEVVANLTCQGSVASELGPDFFEKAGVPEDEEGFDLPDAS